MKRIFPKPITASSRKADTNPMTPSTDQAAPSSHKPRFAYAVATALGTGYLKPGPGTWGSAVGLLIAVISHPFTWFYVLNAAVLRAGLGVDLPFRSGAVGIAVALIPSVAVWLFLALLGVKT